MFLLNHAVPAVEPNVLKSKLWKKASTHVSFFGKKAWVHEMSTAMILVSKFSDVDNLLYNAGLIDDQGASLTIGTNGPVKPEKKRRKKMHTKTGEAELQKEFYGICRFLRKLASEEGFEGRMKKWDAICCSDRGTGTRESMSCRPNTVPLAYQELDITDDDHDPAYDFIVSTGLLAVDDSDDMPSLQTGVDSNVAV